jgi:streptogramin lyase
MKHSMGWTVLRLTIITISVGGPLGASANALGSPTITELSAGNSEYEQPLSIVTAPSATAQNGNLWFTVNGSHAGFGIVSGEELAKVDEPLGSPREVAVGPEGDLWVVENGASPRIEWGDTAQTPYKAAGEILLPADSDPTGIAPGPAGKIWLTEGDGTGQIVEVDTATAKIVGEYSSGLITGGEPAQIVAGSDGDMWFAEHGTLGAIGRIAPSGEIEEFTAGLTSTSRPWGMALGPEGDIWFTEFSAGGKIGRITPSGQITEFGDGLTQGEPGEIATADNGNLYFTERGGEGAVGQITPKGEITEFTSGLTVDNAPWSIASGPDGNMWFTELGQSKVGRLTIAPGVDLASASAVDSSGATLEAAIAPNSQASMLSFEYGTSSAYGSLSPSTPIGEGALPVTKAISLSALAAVTTYHYRAVATNASGTTYGSENTFTTTAPSKSNEPPAEEAPPTEPTSNQPPAGKQPASEAPASESTADSNPPGEDPPPGITPSITPIIAPAQLSSTAPPPTIGHSGTVDVVSGVVLVKGPDGNFEPLGAGVDIPVGSTVNAAHGVVLLTTALPDGTVQSATLWGGSFQFRQSSRDGGMTDIYLRGPLGPCDTQKQGARASAARSHASAHRELWSKDSHGHYTTHGADSAATVLGTEWLTVDSCKGTLTHVRKGRVRVRDLHDHRTVVVRAGQSHLARG